MASLSLSLKRNNAFEIELVPQVCIHSTTSSAYLLFQTFILFLDLRDFSQSFDRATVPIPCRRRVDFFPRCGVSSNEFPSERKKSFGKWVEFVGEAVSTAFPIWVSLGCLLGLMKPSAFNWATPDWTIIGLTITMLGMGMTLTLDDLRGALKMPKELFAGFALQYSVDLSLNALSSSSHDGI